MNSNTPVVVKLSDSTICLQASSFDKIPELSPKVRALVPVADDKDKGARATLELRNLSLKNMACMLSKAHGGDLDLMDYAFLKEHSMISQKDSEIFMAAFNVPREPQAHIYEKTGNGALLALACAGGSMDCLANAFAGKGTGKGMDLGKDRPDSKYTVGTVTLHPTITKNGDPEFIITRNGDLAQTLILKVQFEPRAAVCWSENVLDSLFDSFELSVGGAVFDTIDLSTNNILAKAYGLWPTRNNTPPKNPKESWVATIPIMITETSHHRNVQLIMIGMHYHEVYVKLCKVKQDIIKTDVKFAVDVDYVYLDYELRRQLAQEGVLHTPSSGPSSGRPECPCPSVFRPDPEILPNDDNPTVAPNPSVVVLHEEEDANTKWDASKPEQWTTTEKNGTTTTPPKEAAVVDIRYTVPVVQHHHQRFDIPTDTYTFRLVLNGANMGLSGGYMVVLRSELQPPTSDLISSITPVVSASISINGHQIVVGDVSDITEFYWMKTGMHPPTNNTTLLLPFSREMFSSGVIPSCRVNLSRMESVVLTLEMNTSLSFMKWSGTITTIGMNFRKTLSGMSGLRCSF